MDFLTREQIYGADDRPLEECVVPEWNGKVMVQGLDGEQLDKFESGNVEIRRGKPRLKDHLKVKLVALCIIDPATGKRLFSETDVERLAKKSGRALNRVYEVAAYLSGVKTDVEDDLKNDPSDASPTGSPES